MTKLNNTNMLISTIDRNNEICVQFDSALFNLEFKGPSHVFKEYFEQYFSMFVDEVIYAYRDRTDNRTIFRRGK